MSRDCRGRLEAPRLGALRIGGRYAAVLCLFASFGATAQVEPMPLFETYSDMGGIGLLQMPTARFAPEGDFAFSYTRTSPYIRKALTMQPLPGVEGVLRYTTILDRLYGPESFSGNQTYKDKGFDFKIELLKESEYLPQVAFGIRDVGGTGLFAGEYLVASRRYYDLDVSLGLGWGYLGSRGQLKNPLTMLSSGFKTRQTTVGQGGLLSTAEYFRGERASLIGGVAYQTPIQGLVAKLELDGNNYRNDATGQPIVASSPINVGLTYSYGRWLDVSFGVERGNTVMFGLALHSNLHAVSGMPKVDPSPQPVKPRDLSELVAHNRAGGNPTLTPAGQSAQETSTKLVAALSASGYRVGATEISEKRAVVEASQETFRNNARAVGRAVRIMANNVPASVEELTYVTRESGLETARATLLRQDLEKAVRHEGSPEEIAMHLSYAGPGSDREAKPMDVPGAYPNSNWFWAPAMKHQIGGPDGEYFYQLYVRGSNELQLTRHLSVTSGVALNLADNLDALKLPSDSVLPHVRSDIVKYLKQGKTSLSQFHADYLTNLRPDWYGRASVGYFEEMFGGVGGEVLYRPFDKPWAIGADINRVKQRGYDQRFDFRDYQVDTGHVDLYYRLPFYNMTAQLSVGKYLAGDRGATFALARQFDSGVVIGAFVTKTNVPAEQFGEGSFDKGIFISIPMDLISLYSSRNRMTMGWRPLTRDGGQRLAVAKRLYPIVADSNPDRFMSDWTRALE
ncbi:YjbH domain-containing protein [Propionivibrio dicarboxylicus]|uniref:Exopolysaccharide biosynthesis protein YbjH n=1 Tax=Propionivibrio dicarboxylicus TaxID=83767 RepID=A0A1G8NQI3_9RHOO|nr:YjbH domain-containing protein [Propionivibrio dicarboxylicus]SDH67495.1 Exopolysaccharide biosynthesis protein YbjH [Propionivibrio dicarboxylicus]SDI82422.1 Exopolysaccharide biosynthesis protein YbjH [Propionivibrio dicarboxylicus]